MKNRRNAIIAFLLVAVLCLGIGYAGVVSDTLTVAGTLNASADVVDDEFMANVYFKDDAAVDTTASTGTVGTDGANVTLTRGADATSEENDQLTIEVSNLVFTGVGDTVVVTVSVVNANTAQAAKVTIGSWTDATGVFTVEVTDSGSDEIAASGEAEYTVTITMEKLPAETVATNFTIDLTAEPVV